MAHAAFGSLLRYLHRLHDRTDEATDGELLRRYLGGEKTAFDALLRRHAPMVWGVCRRLLDNEQDAEDAFQAVFLVLLRKAEALRAPQSLAAFLHGVAARVAQKARVTSQRRQHHEARAQTPESSDPFAAVEQRELRALLDEELTRLPEKYRLPLVLCYLEGMSYTEAARQLGWRDGTVCGRLARAREMLRKRLSRRGVTLTVAGLTAVAEPASAPAATMAAVAKMAALFALGQAVGGGVVPPSVATRAQGILQAMTAAKLKAIAGLVMVLGLLTAGAGVTASHFLTMKSPEREKTASAPPDKPTSEKTERTDLYGDPLPPGALRRMGTVRFRANDRIGAIAFSSDGKLLAAGDIARNIILFEAATGRKLRQFQAFTRYFPALAFAPDGKILACADSRNIQLWDLATGKELRRFGIQALQSSNDHNFKRISPLVFSHNGKVLAWAAADRSIRVWEAKTGKELVKLSGHQEPIHCLAFSAEDKKLVSAGGEFFRIESVRVWQLSDGKETRKFSFPRPRDGIADPELLCLSPDGKTFVFAALETVRKKVKGVQVFSPGYAVSFFDLETGRVRRKLKPVAGGRFKTAAFSADGKILAAMNGVGTTVGNFYSESANRLHVWDTATGKVLWDAPAYSDSIHQGPCCLTFSPDGKKLAASSTASALHVWDVASGREDADLSQAHHDQTDCVAFSPDGRTLASGSYDCTIALWDAATGKQRLRLHSNDSLVSSLAFSPDGKRLASACRFNGQTIQLWDLPAGKELRQYRVPYMDEGNGLSTSVDSWVAFHSNGKILAAGGTDRKLRLWDVGSGKELFNQIVHGLPMRPKEAMNARRDYVSEVVFTPDGRIMTVSIGNTIYVADVVAGQRLFQFEKKGSTAASLSLSPDGKSMTCGAQGRSFRLVEIASGKDLHKIDIEMPEHDRVLAVAFAPDGRTVAVAAGRKQGWIFLFDVATGKQRLRLPGGASYVHRLAFSPDGRKLASAQHDSTTLIWDVSAARRKLPRRDLSAKDLERLWIELRNEDAVKAHAALWALAAAPERAVPFLKQYLHPVPRVTPDRLQKLIADLDADEFTRREDASRQLAKLGIECEPALRKALESKLSLEMRRRAEALLNDLVCQTEMTPDALRQLRAIQVLEQIGSPEARNILKSLMQGAPAAPATRDAAAALERLDRRALGSTVP